MEKLKRRVNPCVSATIVVAMMLVASIQQNALALDDIKIGDVDVGVITGYARVAAVWNLQDHPEPDGFGNSIKGKGDLSQLRSTVQLQYVNANLPSFLPAQSSVTVIGRLFKESKTSYLKRLDNVPSQTGNLMDNYNINSDAWREAYIDLPFSDKVKLRFGKQTVAWGETDLVQAMDIINPRNLSWSAPGFDPEDEDLRQALIMANLTISVPEANGALQLLYRPGWDRETQMASTLDLFGGRLAQQPNKGVNSLGALSYNYHHPHGDTDDPSYGFRWTGVAGESAVGYSLAYLHSTEFFPVLNASIPGVITPYKGSIGVPGGVGAEFILPEFDLVGGSVNAYISPLDIVLRSEFSFTKDKVYNAAHPLFALVPLPTTVEKNTVRIMVGFDKQVPLMDMLGTDSASFWTVQLFDSWIPSFDKKDMILNGSVSQKEHSFTLVTTFGLSYKLNTVQPNIALAMDPTYGSAILIPTVSLIYGNHWRVLLSSFFAFPGMLGGKSATPTDPTSKGAFAGYDNNNMVGARLTYQF